MGDSIIVVLGGGVSRDGKLPPDCIRRLEKAVELQRLTEDRIIMSGRWTYIYDYTPIKTEAQAMKECAVSLGAKPGSIIIEEKSMDTLGNAVFSKKMIEKMAGVRAVTVITSEFHLERSRYIFESVFGSSFDITLVGAKSTKSEESLAQRQQFEQKTLSVIKRIFRSLTPGDDAELERVFDKLHPLYAKDPGTTSRIGYGRHSRRKGPQGSILWPSGSSDSALRKIKYQHSHKNIGIGCLQPI